MSLSTTYGLGIVLISLAGVGSAFAANYIHPLKGGAEPPMTALEIVAAEQKLLDEQKRLLRNTDILLSSAPAAPKVKTPNIRGPEEEIPDLRGPEEVSQSGGGSYDPNHDMSGGYRHYLRTTRRQRYAYRR